jgi:hypothetical protein
MRLATPELAGSAQVKVKRGRPQSRKHPVNVVRHRFIDFTDETQRDVEVFGWHPPRARDAALHEPQPDAQRLRNADRCE